MQFKLISEPAALISAPNTGQPQALGFPLSTPFQTNWLGLSANYSALPGYGLTTQQAQDDYDRVALSGVKIVSTWYDMGWAYTAGYPTGSPNWSSANMQWFYAFLSAMQARGVKVMIKMGWHFPQDIGAESNAAPITPTPTNEATFASWVSESLNQIINVQGITSVLGCLFFTEPSTSQIGTIPAGYASGQAYYAHIVQTVLAQIVSDDAGRTPIRPRILIGGPSEDDNSTFPWTQYLKANASASFDAFACHSYRNTPGFAPLGIGAVDSYQPWIDFFASIVATASPQPIFADEGGFVVGGDSDSTGYRQTADAGWQWIRLIDGHMQAGCASSLPWLLSDQPILGDPVTGPTLFYGGSGYIKTGTTVKPSWYALALHANLTGGGAGTSLYRSMSGTANIHGTAVFVPFGVKNAVNPAGEWTFVVINEGLATPLSLNLGVSLGGRTVYRYDYSGEYPPQASGAFLPAWTMKFGGVGNSVPPSKIPGRSMSIFSTMNISAPAFEDLALQAVATSSDPAALGAPGNVNDGNWTNCVGTQNGWKKSTDATQTITLTWPGPVTIGRVKLSFVATTVGVVYATYADTSTPNPLANYTIEYWNGSSWVQVVNESGNTQPSQTHTFAQVSTTAIRLNATSAAATAQINNFGAFAS